AAFFGDFNFYAGLLSLAFQLLVTPRFLRRFGIGASLFALPATVFLGSAGVLAFGTLWSVVVLKGFDQLQRYSLDKSAVELLYLPLSARIKIQVKWFIDTVVWRLGDGLSGLAVFIFATTLHLPARQISWIVLLLVSGWLVAAAVARRQYVATLNQSISQHRVDVEQASMAVLDRSTAELLAAKLSASDPKDILYALSLFEVERQRALHPAIPSLLSHPSPEVRRKAIAILSTSGDKTLQPVMEPLLGDLPDSFDPSLSTLMCDPDTEVVREAIRSVGKLRKRRLVPNLLDLLGHRELCPDAAHALGEIGDTIVGALRDHLGDSSVP